MNKEEIKAFADKIVNFFMSKKGQFVYGQTWTSGCCTEVYPITIQVHNEYSTDIVFQLTKCDKRNFRDFENILIKKFVFIKRAYYVKYDGSCPNVYVIELSFPK